MSTSPYSLDLREKVISFLENGHSKKETSVVFKLNQKTVLAGITGIQKKVIIYQERD